MDFEEWFESRDDIGCFIGLEGYAAKEAWDARQAEIDALKEKIDAALNKIDALSWASESDVEEIKELLK